jgi:hypothetical protein
MTESKLTLREASDVLHLNYSSAKSVIHTYKSMGRILKMGNTHEKSCLPLPISSDVAGRPSVFLPRVLPTPSLRTTVLPVVQAPPLPPLAFLQPPADKTCGLASLPSLSHPDNKGVSIVTHERPSPLLPPQVFNFKLYDETIVGSCSKRFETRRKIASTITGKTLPPPQCLLDPQPKRLKTLDGCLV